MSKKVKKLERKKISKTVDIQNMREIQIKKIKTIKKKKFAIFKTRRNVNKCCENN